MLLKYNLSHRDPLTRHMGAQFPKKSHFWGARLNFSRACKRLHARGVRPEIIFVMRGIKTLHIPSFSFLALLVIEKFNHVSNLVIVTETRF